MPLRRASPRRRLVKFCTKRFRGNVVGLSGPIRSGRRPVHGIMPVIKRSDHYASGRRSSSSLSHAATATTAGASQYRGVRIASRSVASTMTERLM